MERLRRFVDARGGAVLLGEIGETHHPSERLAEYTAPGRQHLGYNNELMTDAFGAALVRRAFEGAGAGSPCWVFSNHDVPRHVSRWMDHAANPDALAKLCAALLSSLEGAICMYQGEELGLTNTELGYDELVDPEGLTIWPDNKGRDGCRTPMPWSAAEPNGGFSVADATWLPLRADHTARAVDMQGRDPDSVLSFYRKMLALRRTVPGLRSGPTRFEETDPPVLAFWRGETLCAFNLGTSEAVLDLPAQVALSVSAPGDVLDGRRLLLPPNGFALA